MQNLKFYRLVVIMAIICTFLPIGSITASAKEVSSLDLLIFSIDKDVPALPEFIDELNKTNSDGLWAENLFAYTINYSSWGYVPDSENTISFASYNDYSGYFIHDYLGGANLYDVQIDDEVAFINNGKVSWLRITGKWMYEASSNGIKCGINAPFYEITGNSKIVDPLTDVNILERHYLEPVTIQTCLCSAGINGVQILVGDWIPSTFDGISDLLLIRRINSQRVQML